MSSHRFCVFCGELPKRKNCEHILPQWLIKMTGNPKRVVNFGTNYKNGKIIKYDWSSFVVPSCEKCNNKYSDIEDRAKDYVERLLERDTLTGAEYIVLMDWLDKVRIGAWIAYHLIQGNPTDIQPKFHINTRISKKDRMIAIYPLTSNEKGLNAFGVESLVFHRQPSCFALKINNILIFNMSSDYLFAARCGFPYPKICETWLDGENAGMMTLDEFEITRQIKHPLIKKKIIKPSIHLYQPIMAKGNKNIYQSGFLGDYNLFDSFIAQHTLLPYPTGKGIIFCQYPDKVKPFYNIDTPIYFQNATGIYSKSIYELVTQVYEFQNYIYKKSKFNANNSELIECAIKQQKILLEDNKYRIRLFQNMKKR